MRKILPEEISPKKAVIPVLLQDRNPSYFKIDNDKNKNTESTKSQLSPKINQFSNRLDHLKPKISKKMPEPFNVINSSKTFFEERKDKSKPASSFSKGNQNLTHNSNNTQGSDDQSKRKASGELFFDLKNREIKKNMDCNSKGSNNEIEYEVGFNTKKIDPPKSFLRGKSGDLKDSAALINNDQRRNLMFVIKV